MLHHFVIHLDMTLMRECERDEEDGGSLVTWPTQHISSLIMRLRIGCTDPDGEVVALSPTTLMAKNRFVCEVCHKGFPRAQNLQLHKRVHNLPWKLKQTTTKDEVKRKMYLCPEPNCIHHNPSHPLKDLIGIKKQYSRKHGERKYKCQNCAKMYAVESDLKAHSKTCGRKEYQCHCGTLFSRRESLTVHKTFCKAPAKGSEINHPPTVSAMGVSFKSSSNHNHPSQMIVSLPQWGSEVPSMQNLTSTSPAIAPDVSQLGRTSHNSLMIRPSLGLNCYKPSPGLFVPTSSQQNQHDQENYNTSIFTNTTPHNKMELYNLNFMGNGMNYGSGTMTQFSATGLHQTLLGSTSSNNSGNNFVQGNTSSSSSGGVGGTTSQKDGLLFASTNFGISECNGLGNINELMNSFSCSDVGSSSFTRYAGATYGQEDNQFHGGLGSVSRGYYDEWKTYNLEEQLQPQNTISDMGFERSSGVTLTTDFLGVGGEMGNISSDGPQNTFGGRCSFL